ncbi:hypothetical protein [Azospirillum sp. B2RO_4]|uniref:hypothetical protein n=1 Tax=Azospirillum sp. B2RO_4 TaxID=3027796 RepID=UPI003DA93368
MIANSLDDLDVTTEDAIAIPSDKKTLLRKILAGNGRCTAGAIQLIGLTSLRSEMGERWNSVKARVHEQTERLLDRHLPPSDVWLRADEENYLVIFATLDRQSAELVCGRIVAELHRIMLGSSDSSRIIVRSIVAEIDGTLTVETASLDQLIAKAMQQGISSHQPAPADSTDEVSTGAATSQHAEVFQPGICFRPVFDASHKVLSTYVCHADDDTKRILGAIPYDDIAGEEYRFMSDVNIINQSMEIYDDLYRNNFRYIQNMTVNFSTLSIGRYRRDYISACHSIPFHLIPFIVFVLQGVPSGVPHSRIAEITAVLKPYSRAVLVLFDDGVPNFATFAQAGVRGLGLIVHPGESDTRAAARIHSFGTQVRRHGMIFFVDGIRTASLLRAAEEAGASYVAGPLIGTVTDLPGHMKHVTERELIQRSAKLPRHI